MEETYKKAPDILTCKDLDYLKDMFGWHHIIYKESIDALNYVQDKSVKDMINEASKLFLENMEKIKNLVKDDKNGE